MFLDALGRRLLVGTHEANPRLWVVGFLYRAQRLLIGGLDLVEGSGPEDGAAVLARTAYESTIVGVWLLADESRLEVVLGELRRQQSTIVRETWGDEPPGRVRALTDVLGEVSASRKMPSLDKIVEQVADWITATEVMPFGVQVSDDGTVGEPIRHSGEPYKSSYVALYRHLSTYAMHGAGAVVDLLDAEGRRLRSTPLDPSHMEPTEILVLVGGLLADAAERCIDVPSDSAEAGEWGGLRMAVRAAVNAVIEDDPREWSRFLDFIRTDW